MSSKKKKYFPNNIDALTDAPSEYFEPCMYEHFMDWKIAGWELPSSVNCIIRETTDKCKVKEYIYERQHAAEKKVVSLMRKGSEFTVVTHDDIHHLHPKFEDLLDDK